MSIVSGHRSFNVISNFPLSHPLFSHSRLAILIFPVFHYCKALRGKGLIRMRQMVLVRTNEMVLQPKVTLPSLFSRIVSLALATLSERRLLDLIVRRLCQGATAWGIFQGQLIPEKISRYHIIPITTLRGPRSPGSTVRTFHLPSPLAPTA